MCPSCIEPGNGLSVPSGSDGKLCFVAILPWAVHANDRAEYPCARGLLSGSGFLHVSVVHNSIIIDIKSTDTCQIIPHFLLFQSKLSFIPHLLDLAASTGSCDRTYRFGAVPTWLQDLFGSCEGIILLNLYCLCPDPVSYDCVFNE